MFTRPRAVIRTSQIAENWRILDRLAPHRETGAVVKADAYGHGAAAAGRALADAGCRSFFVAHVFEGLELRQALGRGPDIYVFHGAATHEIDTCAEHKLIPVLNTMQQVGLWRGRLADRAPAALHFDTGMNRLGLRPDDTPAVRTLLAGAEIGLVMSHFACADEPKHPMNAEQLAAFEAIAKGWPGVKRSLANSAGLALAGAGFDLTRPGIALYGGGFLPKGLGLEPAMTLEAPILEIIEVETGETTGYGATHRFDGPRRLATVAFGYADGLPRAASNSGFAFVDGVKCPIVGRVSMDLTTLDVSEVRDRPAPGMVAEFLGAQAGLEAPAAAAKTLAYELLTGLGARVERIWRN
ncbi:MAG: alanine racemase [Pseudomonadota bacterium]